MKVKKGESWKWKSESRNEKKGKLKWKSES